jgi:prepilin-type processing-associated H-X9-DG protein
MKGIDDSYYYFGYMLDRLGDQYPRKDFTGINSYASLLGIDPLPPGEGPAQGIEMLEKILGNAVSAYLAANVTALNAVTDKDLSVTAGNGNAGGATVYRLREGIERFLITDINNPAATARAQSEIAIMYDSLATVARAYNHIPGGSNVLYMDGHVAFIRYPGEPPVNEGMARLVGPFFAGV